MGAKKKLKERRLSTMRLLMTGFFGIILIGGVLLWMPFSNTAPISFIDALFTSVTAVCVTGLVTVTPAVQFTLIGKIILLLLIQIGGLGIIACMMGFFIIAGKQITVRERVYIQQTYNMDTLSGMVRLILWVIKVTFAVEGAGAPLYAVRFVPEFGILKGIWFAVFHAVSAFCNAGIDILGNESLAEYVKDPLINLTTIGLIIVSGLGFTVWADIIEISRKKEMRRRSPERFFRQLSLQSKMAVIMTAVLIAAGSAGTFFLEYANAGTIGALPAGEKIMASFFHSVSTRTAGFATVPQGNLREATIFFTCILMFIGGSPGGTAGGVKTTTVMMLFCSCITVLRGGRDTECFGRKIPSENVRTGASVVMAAVTALIAGTVLVAAAEPKLPVIDILYETTSAVGTVGLSVGITSSLSTFSKCVIMFLMYIGRLGPVTIVLAFIAKQSAGRRGRTLPEKRIMVG